MADKKLYIISGCNGAGKTTASYSILPEILSCKEFVNADEIAKGLSPFQPQKVAIEAGRIMLKRIDELLQTSESFAFETTLATKSYKKLIDRAREKGYHVTLLFFWLQTVDLAKERVQARVLSGGHNVEPSVIERRYWNGIRNLFDIYISISDVVMVFDSSGVVHNLIAKKTNGSLEIANKLEFNKIKQYYEDGK